MSKKKKAKMSGDKIFGIIMVVLIVVLIAAMIIFKNHSSSSSTSSNSVDYTQETEHNIDVKNQPTLGNEDAPVTVVEYGDYKCPACGYFESNIFPQLEADYINTGKVKFVFKQYPFIYKDSARAAIYTEGVYAKLGNDAFWKLHKEIYNYQNTYYANNQSQNEQKDILTETYLDKTAKKLFGNEKGEELQNIVTNDDYKHSVNSDLKQGKNDDVSGTPAVYVDGKMVYQPLNYEYIKGAIDKALKNGEEK